MKASLLLAALLLAGTASAQTPAQPTKEQVQMMMARQMQAMAALFDYRRSKLGFDDTVTGIGAAMDKQGWKKGAVHDVQEAMAKAGMADGQRMKVVLGCPAGFNEKLAKASAGKLPPHPCRFTVLQGRDGKAYVMRMNTGHLAKGVQGEASTLLAGLAGEEEAILKGLVE